MSKSDFLSRAEQMHSDLGPALCLAKWKQVSLHLPTGLNNSCYHPPLHRISIEDIGRNPGALHNTTHKKEQRKLMLAGVKPAECSYCWNMEAHDKLSDRHYRSGEPWAAVPDMVKPSGSLTLLPPPPPQATSNVLAAKPVTISLGKARIFEIFFISITPLKIKITIIKIPSDGQSRWSRSSFIPKTARFGRGNNECRRSGLA
jgi:hypothetical protein